MGKARSLKEKLDKLLEKLIVIDNGAAYNNVVIMAGGAASGKGWTVSTFMDGDKFKVMDVDEMKRLLLLVNDLKDKYPELKGLDLKNPKDVYKLHDFVASRGLNDKKRNLLLADLKQDRKPNLLFDVTLKNKAKLEELVSLVTGLGYQPKNIHIVWVLSNYVVGVKRNRERPRVVPDDILLQTHSGAAITMTDLVSGNIPSGVDGAIHVVLNNPQETVFWADKDGKPIKNTRGEKIIKGFKYITVKRQGKGFESNSEVQKRLFDYIKQNIPKTRETEAIFDL